MVFSTIVEAAVKKGTLTLILTDRTQLFSQTVDSIQSFGIPVCKIDPDNRHIAPNAKMFIGMAQTVLRRIETIKHIPFQLIICDEAHSGIFNRIFDTWPTSHVIGATATPVGKHLHKYYTNLVACIDTPELVEKGFLAPCKTFQMVDDFSDLETDNKGEYTDKSLYDHFNKTKIYEGVIDAYLNKTPGEKAICFNVNVAHTVEMTKAFNSVGIKSFCITSKTPDKEKEWIMSEFSRNAFPVLNNCGILTKGYNEPAITTVILNRATTSLALKLQMEGRGSRTFPGKKLFTVLDFGGNTDRHGLWQEERTWTLEPPKKRKKGLGAAPVKSCKACEAMLPATARECPYCGYLFAPTEKELAQGRLVEVTNKIRAGIAGRYVSDLTIPELIECEKSGEMKSTYVWRVLRSRDAIAVGEYARLKGYRDAWIVRQLEAMDAEGQVQFFDKKINELPLIK